jgi:hypothetical protein
MGKQALNTIVKNITKKIEGSKDLRYKLNLNVHEYTVDSSTVYKEVKYQLSDLIKTLGNPSISQVKDRLKKLKSYVDIYVKAIYDSMDGRQEARVTFKPGSSETSFTAILSSDKDQKTKQGKAIDIFTTINNKRTKKHLPDLRTNIADYVFTGISSPELDTALKGSYRRDKETNELIKTIGGEYIRSGGLLQLGHEKAGSVSYRRKAEILKSLGTKAGASSILARTKISKTDKVAISLLVNTYAKGEAGDLIKDFTTVIKVSEESAFRNQGDSSSEKAFLNALKLEVSNYLKTQVDFFNTKSSSSASDIVVDKLLSSMKFKNMKTTKRTKAKSSKTSSDTSTIKQTIKSSSSVESLSGSKIAPDKQEPSTQVGSRNWLSLLPIINAKLAPRVLGNMRSPALVNRTGTFANSTKVVNVEQTREGYPSFVFDYERNPYDVFDRTKGRSPWNTPERDPRALVDRSLREIVREMAIGRFYTRRA